MTDYSRRQLSNVTSVLHVLHGVVELLDSSVHEFSQEDQYRTNDKMETELGTFDALEFLNGPSSDIFSVEEIPAVYYIYPVALTCG